MKSKKMLAALLCIVLMLALAVPTFAVEYNDVEGTHFQASIERVTDYGIVSGYGDGSFKPGNYITRQAFCRAIVNFTGWTEKADAATMNEYVDVKEISPNLYDYVAICVANGAMSGYVEENGTKTIRPTQCITRQAAARLIATAIGVDISEREDAFVTPFKDQATIYSGLLPYVKALANGGIVLGYVNGNYGPSDYITRGAMMAIIDRILVSNTEFGAELKATATATNNGAIAALAVFDRFDATAFIPAAVVKSDKVEVTGWIEKVDALDMTKDATYEHSFVNNNAERQYELNLNTAVPNLYSFRFASLQLNLADFGGPYYYNILGEEATIKGIDGIAVSAVPTNAAAVRALYNVLVDKNTVKVVEDAGIAEGTIGETANIAVLANGSYIKAGTKMVAFDPAFKGDFVFDDFSKDIDLGELADAVKAAFAVSDCEKGSFDAVVYLAAGTKIAFKDHTVELLKPITVDFTIDNFEFDFASYIDAFDFSAGNTEANRTAAASFANNLLAALDQAVVVVNVTVG